MERGWRGRGEEGEWEGEEERKYRNRSPLCNNVYHLDNELNKGFEVGAWVYMMMSAYMNE